MTTFGVESEPRFGHSVCEYKQNLYIFGGGTDFNSTHKLRECINGVKQFQIEKSQLVNLKSNGSYITTRKQHCSAIIGKHMFIHGGFNQKNNLLDDSAIFNVEKAQWKLLNIKGISPGFRGFHTAVTVLIPEQRNAQSIYKIPAIKKNAFSNSGIYVFGGLDSLRRPQNSLYFLKVGTKPLTWTIPYAQGQPPSPRFQHSMTYNEKLNIILIFGGRVDLNNTSHYSCFNDVFILKISNLLWVSSNVLGNIPSPRSGHCAAAYGSKVFIFGGVSNSAYCSSSLYMLELNPKTARKMIEDEEKRKAKELEIEILKAKKQEFSQDSKKKTGLGNPEL